MVSGFHGDSFASICASEDSRSLIGGSTIVNVSDGLLTITISGKGPGCAMLVGIVVHYTLLYINGGEWGASLINVV